LLGLDKLAIELVAGVDAADHPSPGASANEHADPTPRLHGEQLLITGSWSFAGTGPRCRRTSRHDNTASPDVRGAQQGLPGRWRSTPADHVQNWLCHLIMRHRWRRRRRTGGTRRRAPCQVRRRTTDGRRRPGPQTVNAPVSLFHDDVVSTPPATRLASSRSGEWVRSLAVMSPPCGLKGG
jgi:hypothetical protein